MIILPMFFGVGSIYVGSFAIDFVLTFIIMIILKKEFGQLRKMNLT